MRYLLFTWGILLGFTANLWGQNQTKDTPSRAERNEIYRAEQCDFHRKISAAKLQEGYAYIRGFKLCGSNCADCNSQKGIFRLVLEAGNEYALKISNWRGETYAVLYDDKGNRIGKSLHNGKIYDGFRFICNSTGIYYLRFFDQNKRPVEESLIGGASLGLKRWKF